MSRALFVSCAFVLLWPASSRASESSLGASMSAGATSSAAHNGTSTTFGLPGNALTYQPGFRLGYGSERRVHEVILDTGALVIGEQGSTVSLILGSLSYQHAFGKSSTSNPIANLGFGFLREGSALAAGSNVTMGAGIGWRRVLRD